MLRSIVLMENTFTISFQHSVNRGMVEEEYAVNPETDGFYLHQGRFESFGAGMLDELPEDAILNYDDTFLVVTFLGKEEQRKILYAAAGIANHVLTSGSQCIFLYQINPNKTSVISIEKRSIFDTIVALFH